MCARASSFHTTLTALQNSIDGIEIAQVADHIETEDILAGVEAGKYDITLCDSNLLDVERAYGRRLKAAFSIKPTALGWGRAKEQSGIAGRTRSIHRTRKRRFVFQHDEKAVFSEQTRSRQSQGFPARSIWAGSCRPYDDLVKKYAYQYGQDWRLTTAQMYQESKFDPKAVSWVGAQGLMQVMPRTGRQLGFTKLYEPHESIHAGVKYMHQLINRFDHNLPMDERIRFALASYNVGYGHVLDARRLAREKGWDADRWFGHVERAMRPALPTRLLQTGAIRLLPRQPTRTLRREHPEFLRRVCRNPKHDHGRNSAPRRGPHRTPIRYNATASLSDAVDLSKKMRGCDELDRNLSFLTC